MFDIEVVLIWVYGMYISLIVCLHKCCYFDFIFTFDHDEKGDFCVASPSRKAWQLGCLKAIFEFLLSLLCCSTFGWNLTLRFLSGCFRKLTNLLTFDICPVRCGAVALILTPYLSTLKLDLKVVINKRQKSHTV